MTGYDKLTGATPEPTPAQLARLEVLERRLGLAEDALDRLRGADPSDA